MGVEIKVGEAFKEVADRTPTGAVVAYAGETAPTGWLVCDGSQVSRTTYADLFSVVGTAFGSGDGVNTFHLPDLRGRFVRGWANGSTRDPDRASRTAMNTGGVTGDEIGSVQGGATVLTSHTHAIDHNHAQATSASPNVSLAHSHVVDLNTGAGQGSKVLEGATGGPGHTMSTDSSSSLTHTHTVDLPSFAGNSGSPSTGGGNETRPTNAYLNYIIKY